MKQRKAAALLILVVVFFAFDLTLSKADTEDVLLAVLCLALAVDLATT